MEPTHFEQLYPPKTRFAEIKKLIEILKAGRSAQIVGLPGVGKSNVLRLLPYNREVRELHLREDESKFHFIYMDFSEVRARPFFEIIKFIFISLSYSLGERRLEGEQKIVNDFLRESLEFNDDLILFQGLKKSIDFLAKEKGLYLVFLFDRFEDYIPTIDEKFFLNLKILRNRIKYNFLAVFAVTRPIEDVLEVALFGEFYEFIVGNTVFLPLKDETGLSFRLSYIEKITGKEAGLKIKQEIDRLTGGHGKLAKLAYEACLAEKNTAKDIEKLLLSKKQIKGALFEIWNYLLPEERLDLKEKQTNEFLEKVGLSKNGKITIPLFASYLSTFTLSAGEKQKLTYDPVRNEIKKGQESLTEKLTPSEFRLLRFLMINTDRVCEKNEIIENVWKEDKTQAGVTDQALDQIIYRLRKKIEDDPESPTHIQTIKGRGYKFTSFP